MRASLAGDVQSFLTGFADQVDAITCCQMQDMQMCAEDPGQTDRCLNRDQFGIIRTSLEHGRVIRRTCRLHFIGQSLDDAEVLSMNRDHLACLRNCTEHLVDLSGIKRRNDIFHALIIIVDQLILFGDRIAPEEFETDNTCLGKLGKFGVICIADAQAPCTEVRVCFRCDRLDQVIEHLNTCDRRIAVGHLIDRRDTRACS